MRSGFGRAHASRWRSGTGVQDLGFTLTNQSSRANCANYNGNVVAGWVETPTGPWRPAVWANGTHTLLTEFGSEGQYLIGHGEVKASSPDGNVLVGFAGEPGSHQRAAAMWKCVNGVWQPTQHLGWVDGTEAVYGINIANAVSAAGDLVVGYCSFDGSPFGTTGFVWTPSTGVKDVNEYLAANGVFLDPNFTIQNLIAMTPDGTQLIGLGQMLTAPYAHRAFRITRPANADAPLVAPLSRLELAAPRPNPSRGAVQLELALAVESEVDLGVFDAAGRRVTTLLSGNLAAGRRTITWDGLDANGRPAAAGLYFARVLTPHGSASHRLVRVN